MASLYAQYLREITNDLIVENENGFATYRYLNDGKSVYIIDIFIIPEKRRMKEKSRLADAVIEEAKKNGCKELLGTIAPSSKGSTISLKAQLSYGMELHSATNDAIILRKDI